MSSTVEMRHSAVELLILKTLSWGPQHGYSIARWIQQTTDDALRLEEGSLYPALRRLVHRRLIHGRWGPSENNRRAKYYELTDRGRAMLSAESSKWFSYAAAVTKVLRATRQPA
jgi:PadR family transcriptional regulator PadR